MASRFPSAWLDELRSRADIVQVVSGYVTLKRNGHKYWGLCPFHGEKTASFSVDPEQSALLLLRLQSRRHGDFVHYGDRAADLFRGCQISG